MTAPAADIDFAYVLDSKLVKECDGCKAPFVIMYKQGESDSPQCVGERVLDALPCAIGRPPARGVLLRQS